MSKRTRTWVLVGLLVGTGLLVIVGSRALGPRVTVAQVQQREIVQTVIVSGRVLPPARVNIGSLVPGVVTQVAVKEGDHVKPGDLLVQLDDAEARAGLLLAKAGLKQARARLSQLKHITAPVAREAHKQADANLELARLSYERQLALLRKGSATPAQLDEAKRALDVAQSQHDATEKQAAGSAPRGADHALAVAAHAQAAASVAQAEVRLGETRITAATAAVVLTRSVEPGELIQPGRAMLVLARDGKTQLSVQPDEKNLAELRLGQPAQASADAFPKRPFAASVSFIAPSIDPQRGTVEVRFDVPAPPEFLRPDMTVSVNIEVGRHPAALVIPKEAVLDLAAAKPWLFVLQGSRIERRSVELGLRAEGQIEVLRGVAAGEAVVIPNGTLLVSGQRVRARPALAPSRAGGG